ncbi:MAG: cupredoxin domain-containing protein [Gemmatimonadaceae bacterium]
MIITAVALSCFSERSVTTAPVTGECQVPISATGSTLVAIRDFRFVPALVRVRAGEKVTWVNCDPPGTEAHTSTSDGPAWDSGLMAPGAVFTRTFDQAGTLPYHCEPHPFMTGSVVVE